MNRTDRLIQLCRAVCLGLVLLPLSARALSVEEVDAEFEFATELINLGMSDYADRVTDKLVKADPKLKGRAQVLKALILVAQKKIEEAEAVLAKLDAKDPKVQAANLKIANILYSIGRIPEAKKRYNAFFAGYGKELPKDKDLLQAYVEAAWRQSIMLRDDGDFQGGVTALNRVLSKNPKIDSVVIRKLQLDAAYLNLELAKTLTGKEKAKERQAALKKATDLANEVTFKGYDPLFMEAINIIVDVKITQNKLDEAIELINTYSSDLRTYEKQLIAAGRENESPLAGLRYLRGTVYEKKANELNKEGKTDAAIKAWVAAVKDYFNVFKDYPGSDWGIKAGLSYEECRADFNTKTGKTLQLKMPPGVKPPDIGISKFASANILYKRRQFSKVISLYEDVLNSYPEVKQAPEALRKLAVSYIETGDPLSAQAAAGYLGERLGRLEGASNEMLLIAGHFQTKELKKETNWVYERFVDYFPKDEQAPKILYLLAGSEKNAGNIAEEQRLLARISRDYPDSKYAKRSDLKAANKFFKDKRYDEALPIYTKYIGESNPGFTLGDARFREAFCYAQMDNIAASLKAFNALKKDLAVEKDNPYLLGDLPEKIPELQERVAFQFANTLTRVDKAVPNAAVFRAKGLELYEEFLKTYPKSSLAATAWYDKGFLLLEAGKNAEAVKAFETLSEKYPDTEYGKDALYTMIKAAFEAGQPEVARNAVNKLLKDPDYGADKFIRVGQLVLENKMFKEAEECMQLVLKDPKVKDPTVKQLALFGLAESKHVNKKYEDCIAAADQMLKDYPKSPKFFDLKFLIADCYKELKKYREANEVHAEVSKLAMASNMKVVSMRNDLAIAKLEATRGDAQKALASFQRITMFGNANDDQQVPLLKEAFAEAIKLLQANSNWKELQATLQDYITAFPKAKDIDQIKSLKRKVDLKVIS